MLKKITLKKMTLVKLLKGKIGRTRSISERRGRDKASTSKTKDQQQPAAAASKATKAPAAAQKADNLLSSN